MATEQSGDGIIEFDSGGIPYQFHGDMFHVVAADTKQQTLMLLREGKDDTPENRLPMPVYRIRRQLDNGASKIPRQLAELLHFEVSEDQVL
jgi:hypothetical protein